VDEADGGEEDEEEEEGMHGWARLEVGECFVGIGDGDL